MARNHRTAWTGSALFPDRRGTCTRRRTSNPRGRARRHAGPAQGFGILIDGGKPVAGHGGGLGHAPVDRLAQRAQARCPSQRIEPSSYPRPSARLAPEITAVASTHPETIKNTATALPQPAGSKADR